MKISNRKNEYQRVSKLLNSLQAKTLGIDVLRQGTVSGWSLGNTITFTYDTELTNYHRFTASLPSGFTNNSNNTMSYRLNNFSDLYVQYLGDVTTFDEADVTNNLSFGYTATALYLYVSNDGEDMKKYLTWLPTSATTQEKTLFLNTHVFKLDYKNS